MGNLCSSGTERRDKKDEGQVPDKPRDGEDEALLPSADVDLGVGPEGVQVSVGADVEGAGVGGGFVGVLGGAVKSGISDVGDVTRNVGQQGQLALVKGVDEVQTSAAATVTESAEKVKAAAEEAVDRSVQNVENNARDVFQSATGKLEETAEGIRDSVSAGATNVEDLVQREAETAESEAQSWTDNSKALVAEGAALTDSAADRVHESITSEVDTLQSETISASADLKSSAEDEILGGGFRNVNDQFGNKVDEIVATAESVAGDAKQTAENKLNEAVANARSSAVETVASWSETAAQKVGDVAGGVSGEAEATTDLFKQTWGTQESGDEKGHESAFEQPDFGLVPITQPDHQQFVENLVQSGHADEVNDTLQGFSKTADENSQELNIEAVRMIDPVQETCSAGLEDTWSEVPDAPQDFCDEVLDAFEKSRTEEVAECAAGIAAKDPFSQEQQEEIPNLIVAVQATAEDALEATEESVKGDVLKKVGFSEVVDREDVPTNEANYENDEALGADHDFLEKAKSLLEAHRNSLDGGRDSSTNVEVPDEDIQGEVEQRLEQRSEESSQEATAREFVESIIEKATSLVSESLAQNEAGSDGSSPNDPVVDRGEETLAPKKRGVMFVSPQISDKSSSSPSSPQDISPPPPPHESDLSPLADSSSSSICQGDLVETDDLLAPPSLPAEYSLNENNNNNNNILNNNAEDDDESIQRVAMEVTAKAVQDAIKIVSENGTGLVLTSNDLLNNGTVVSSPSSPDNEDEEMTTTDSSQVERGSPVSDITDTSAHGSVSESLSSYDPGAVFRQDVTNIPDLASSPSGSSKDQLPEAVTEASVSKPHDKTSDLINFEDGCTSHDETLTPTNSTYFETNPHQSPQESNDDPSHTVSSDVPSAFPPEDGLPSSPNKPMIVINSPDSAHHTNGSCEDVSSPQTEALI